MSQRAEEAAVAVQRALLACMGPAAAEHLASAQLRLAWQETVVAAGLDSRRVEQPAGAANATGWATLKRPRRSWPRSSPCVPRRWSVGVNQRLQGRPGATIELRRLAISVGRGTGSRSL